MGLVFLVFLQLVVYVVGLAAGLEWLGHRATRDAASAADVDAVVVLGCRVRPDGSASPTLVRRTEAGAALARALPDACLVLSGGVLPGAPRAEADAAAEHVRGLAPERVLRDVRSTTTDANAEEVARLLQRELDSGRFGAGRTLAELRLVVVTDAYHLPRSMRLFRRAFRSVRGHGVIGSPSGRVRGALREAFVVVAYLARGKFDVVA